MILPKTYKDWGWVILKLVITIGIILGLNYVTTKYGNKNPIVPVVVPTTADKVIESKILESKDSLRILNTTLPVLRHEITIKEKSINDINTSILNHHVKKTSIINDVDSRTADSIIANARYIPGGW